MTDLLKPIEAAEVLGVSPRTLATWRRENKGPNYFDLSGSIRYKRTDLQRYLRFKEQYVTTCDAAKLLNVTAETLRKWHQQKKGPRSIVDGRRIYFFRPDIQAYLDARRVLTDIFERKGAA